MVIDDLARSRVRLRCIVLGVIRQNAIAGEKLKNQRHARRRSKVRLYEERYVTLLRICLAFTFQGPDGIFDRHSTPHSRGTA
jgi:hypothetical protein